MLSHVRLLVIPWTIAHWAPQSMGFSRQECWSGLPGPPPGDLPDPGIEPEPSASPALQEDSLSLSHQGSLKYCFIGWYVVTEALWMSFHGHPSPHSSSPGVTRTSNSYKFNAQNRICPQDSAPFWGLRHKFSGTPLSALPFSLGSGSSSPHCLIGSLIAQTYSIYFLQLFWLFLVRVLVSNKPVCHC